MEYSRLIVERGEDHVASVTLNRPEKMNAFDSPMAEELLAAFSELDSCPKTRVVLVRGAGRNFCAGIDVSEILGK
ncbi:MAG: enoyl-CoA hydratase/isomerase family protein, partial [Thermovirga sp.]|nr:enoyl-CoA hydratase/isomerase family protein [Thermovirga sp.]